MTTERHRFDIARIGRAALAALAPGRRGSVLAIFRRSFYVECDGGALACIGPAGMGDGPLNGLARLPEGIDWQASGLAVGAPAHVDGRALRIGNRFEFGLESAAEWSPTRLPDGWSRDSLISGLAELCRAAGRFDLSQGLARLVMPDAPGDDALIVRGRAGAEALRKWIVGSEDRAEALQVAGCGGR